MARSTQSGTSPRQVSQTAGSQPRARGYGEGCARVSGLAHGQLRPLERRPSSLRRNTRPTPGGVKRYHRRPARRSIDACGAVVDRSQSVENGGDPVQVTLAKFVVSISRERAQAAQLAQRRSGSGSRRPMQKPTPSVRRQREDSTKDRSEPRREPEGARVREDWPARLHRRSSRSPELGPESLRGNDDEDRDYAVTERPGAVAQGRRAVTYSAKGESHHTGGEREQSAKEEDGPG